LWLWQTVAEPNQSWLLIERKLMPGTKQVLEEARDLIKARLDELTQERKNLEAALSALSGRVSRRAPARKRSQSARPKAAKPRPPRRRRKGTRADQALALVKANPGGSASDIAKAMKMKPNYLYRILAKLEKEGRVKKEGRNYLPVS
jgi:predicted Rossmann fold nucleotide-binding protein DprA/Smf involved in DNA uptake